MEKKRMHQLSGEDASLLSFVGTYGITFLKRTWWKRRFFTRFQSERAREIGQAILDLYNNREVANESIRNTALSIVAWVFTNRLDFRRHGYLAMDALLRRDDEPCRTLRNILQKYHKLDAVKKKYHCSA